MSFKYPAYRIARIVKRLGQNVPVTIKQQADTFNAVTGIASGVTYTQTTVPGVVSVLETDFSGLGKSDIANTVYQVLISNASLGITPKVGDFAVFNSQTFRVLKVDPGYIGDQIDSWYLWAAS